MKCGTIPSGWIREEGCRLDSWPYLSGAVQSRLRLKALSGSSIELHLLTAGHNGGIFNGPKFRRTYVNDRNHGVPFITSGGMLAVDLGTLPLLRRADAESNKLRFLQLTAGTTLIGCSGTIGRMAYVRPGMAGMWSSQDVIKVVPDPAKIPPGYLYAFLSSEIGAAIVSSRSYGAIIPHLEPEHVADLPIPRLGHKIETQAHSFVQNAAGLRDEADRLIADAIRELEAQSGLPPLETPFDATPFCVRSLLASELEARLDAFYHSEYHLQARRPLQLSRFSKCVVDASESIVEPQRFKRVHVDDKTQGIPFFGTAGLFWNEPLCNFHIPRRLPGVEQYIVDSATLLLPRSGQLTGVIGRVVYPYGDVLGAAVSEDAIRVRCRSAVEAGFLFVALSSEYCRRQLKARAYGSSIPHIDVNSVGAVLVPFPDKRLRDRCGQIGVEANQRRGEAIALERRARELVLRACGGAS